jgi:hypothetical protein
MANLVDNLANTIDAKRGMKEFFTSTAEARTLERFAILSTKHIILCIVKPPIKRKNNPNLSLYCYRPARPKAFADVWVTRFATN